MGKLYVKGFNGIMEQADAQYTAVCDCVDNVLQWLEGKLGAFIYKHTHTHHILLLLLSYFIVFNMTHCQFCSTKVIICEKNVIMSPLTVAWPGNSVFDSHRNPPVPPRFHALSWNSETEVEASLLSSVANATCLQCCYRCYPGPCS